MALYSVTRTMATKNNYKHRLRQYFINHDDSSYFRCPLPFPSLSLSRSRTMLLLRLQIFPTLSSFPNISSVSLQEQRSGLRCFLPLSLQVSDPNTLIFVNRVTGCSSSFLARSAFRLCIVSAPTLPHPIQSITSVDDANVRSLRSYCLKASFCVIIYKRVSRLFVPIRRGT